MAMGMWQGLASSTKQLPSMGMGLLQMRQRQEEAEALRAIQKDQLTLRASEVTSQNAIREEEKKKLELERKTREAFVPISSIAPQLSSMPGLSKHWESAVTQSGFPIKEVGGERYVQQGAIDLVQKLMKTNMDFAGQSLKLTQSDLSSQLIALTNKMNDPENKLAGKELENATAQKEMLKKKIADVLSADMEFQKQLALRETSQAPRAMTEQEVAMLPPDDPRRINAISYKQETQKPTTVTPQLKTIYGPNGATKEVSITPGTDYVPPKDWSLTKPEKPAKVNNVVLTNTATKERRTVDKNSDEYINLTEAGWEVAKPPRQMPANDINGLQGFTDLRSIAESLKGIGTKYAGPITGRARLLSAKFFDDPDFVSAKSKLGKLMPVIYSLSGKQINEWEKKWLKEDIIPNLTSPGANFEATLQSFIEWIDMKDKNLRTSYEEGGYIVPPPGKAKMEGTKKKPLSQY